MATLWAQTFRSPIDAAAGYSWDKCRRDALAGLTVAAVEIPQAMAYAFLAGVPPQYGVYASVIMGAVAALFSSSQHVATGPTNTQSLLVASAVSRLAGASPEVYLQLVFALAVLKGLLQIAFAAARLGDMVRYVSRSVIVGLASGAGVLILVGQVPALLGVTAPRGTLPGVIGDIERIATHVDQINPTALAIGIGAVAVTLGGRLVSRLFPGALLAVVMGAAAVWMMGLAQRVPVVGDITGALPSVSVPDVSLDQVRSLMGGALALALLGSLESVAIAKTLAARTGERIDANQEFLSQGLANTVGGFLQCIPGSVSFTRSALDHAAGGATRFAAVMTAAGVGLVFLAGSDAAEMIPAAALAGVLMVIAAGLVDLRYVPRVARTNRGDAVVAVVTFAATLTIPLEYAIFVGIFLNIGLYLRTAAKLHLHEMVPTGDARGPFIERPLSDRSGNRKVLFLQAEGDLFFAISDELQDRLAALHRTGVKVVILRLKRTHSIDATVLDVLEQFVKNMRRRHGYLLLCGVRPELRQVLKAYGLIDLIGRENVFEAGEGVFGSAKKALERARTLVESSIDMAGFDLEDEDDEITYEI